MRMTNLKLGRGGPPGMDSVVACDTCPAHRFAMDSGVRWSNSRQSRGRLAMDEDRPKQGGFDAFMKVGRALAQKLSATDWMDLRIMLLEGGAADDLPLNGTKTDNGLPRDFLESERDRPEAMDARMSSSSALASFDEMFPGTASVRHAPGPTPRVFVGSDPQA
jgi:hypothetical protein